MARVRVIQDGRVIHNETQTFDQKKVASAWVKKRETELSQAPVEGKATQPTLREAINRYLEELDLAKPAGRSKAATLRQISKTFLGALQVSNITSAEIVDFSRHRIRVDGVKPQTVQNDLILLNGVFSVAEPAWGYKLDKTALDKGRAVAKNMGLTDRADERNRVPTMDELKALMVYFADQSRRRPWVIPMVKIVAFAIFSTRRQEEISRIRWDDLNEEERTVLVRDVKHPTHKIGNHVEAKLVDEAWRIVQSMPRISEYIFPFKPTTISAQFTRACAWLDIEDLRFHDMRRAGVTRLFEMGWNIPQVANVSLHRDWNMLRRYTNMKFSGDRYVDWVWKEKAVEIEWKYFRKGDGPITTPRLAFRRKKTRPLEARP